MKKKLLILIMAACFFSCKRDDEVYSLGNTNGINISQILKFDTISNLNPEADTAAISVINVKINPEADSANRTVAFTTDLGYFTNGKTNINVTADAYGNVKAGIKSAVPGDAMINAAIKAATINTIVHFVPALPDDIIITADNYNTDTTQSITITAKLFRSTGRGLPTDPTKIWLDVTPNTLIYPAFTNSIGHEGTIVIKNPFHAVGAFKVETKTVGSSGDTLRRIINILIK